MSNSSSSKNCNCPEILFQKNFSCEVVLVQKNCDSIQVHTQRTKKELQLQNTFLCQFCDFEPAIHSAYLDEKCMLEHGISVMLFNKTPIFSATRRKFHV